MAQVETIKSLAISNRDASPVVPTSASIAGGLLRSAEGDVVTGATDSIGSYYPMVSVPSNARVETVKVATAAQGTSCTANVGVFVPTQTNPNLTALSSAYIGAAAINASFFASAYSIAGASGYTDVTNQSTTNTIAKQGQELWQALGLASDPGCMLDIGIQLAAATVAGGALGLKVAYAL